MCVCVCVCVSVCVSVCVHTLTARSEAVGTQSVCVNLRKVVMTNTVKAHCGAGGEAPRTLAVSLAASKLCCCTLALATPSLCVMAPGKGSADAWPWQPCGHSLFELVVPAVHKSRANNADERPSGPSERSACLGGQPRSAGRAVHSRVSCCWLVWLAPVAE